jgi:hypothetical protein
MKRYLIILTLLIFAGMTPAKADYIATHNFEIDVDTTMTVVVSGTMNTNITGANGTMGTPLNINFNIATNQDVNGITLKAMVTDSTESKLCACCGCETSGPASSLTTTYILANDTHKPMAGCVENCKTGSCTSMENENTIAYPATITINNEGTVQKVVDAERCYFSADVKSGVTDLNLTLSPTPKVGTYDIATAQDEPDNYVLEVFLDNIPS